MLETEIVHLVVGFNHRRMFGEARPMARDFDAIVVGSGLGGLTAGALCARAGMKLLVVERNEAFGGAATTFHHNRLAIESSLHEIDGFDDDDPKIPLIRSLGLDRSIDFVDVGDLYAGTNRRTNHAQFER